MIGYYLSNNNEIFYNVKNQTFSPTKHTCAPGVEEKKSGHHARRSACGCIG
jgi:hypothetical protein